MWASPGELLMAMSRSLQGEAIGVCGGDARLAGLVIIIINLSIMTMTLVTLMALIDDGGLGNLTRNHHQGFRKILSPDGHAPTAFLQ